jgi:hypothetical protein
MSSPLTKLIISFASSLFVSHVLGQNNVCKMNLNLDEFDITVNLDEFDITAAAMNLTYSFMTCVDIYHKIYGTTKIITRKITTKDHSYICKKYNVRDIDTKKAEFTLISGLTGAVIAYCTDPTKISQYHLMAMIGSEITADVFNLNSPIIAHEIDGDDWFVIT